MARKTVPVKVNPGVFKWILESGGWTPNDLAERAKVTPETIDRMQHEEIDVDAMALKRMAKALKRPLAVFFLPEPPAESKLPDFRKAAGTGDALSKKTLSAIQRIRYLQSVAHDLLRAQNANQRPGTRRYSVDDSAERAADAERDNLVQMPGSGAPAKNVLPYEFYNNLRERIESLNIFVCQSPLSLDDTRGFSLSDSYPCMMVVSTKDKIEPRIFTLLHEYAHILLGESGICLPDHGQFRDNSNEAQRIEKWCNEFAGHVLMPREEFTKEVEKHREKSPDALLKKLSKKFHASMQAVSVQFDILNMHRIYDRRVHFRDAHFADEAQPSRGAPRIPPAKKCISQNGRKFVTLVLESNERKLVNHSDMIEYLDIGLKHIGDVQKNL